MILLIVILWNIRTNKENSPLLSGDSGVLNLTSTATDSKAVTSYSLKRNTDYSGGQFGYVCSNLLVDTTLNNSGIENFEWGLLSVLRNYSDVNSSQNTAAYFQSQKYGDSSTWGCTIEASEKTAGLNTSIVGLEVDLFGAGGNKQVSQKTGIDMVFAKTDPLINQDAIQPNAGIRVNNWDQENALDGGDAILVNVNGDTNHWDKAFTAKGHFLNTCLDTTQANVDTGIAIQMAEGQKLAFDTTGDTYIQYVTSPSPQFNFVINGVVAGHIP